MRLPRQAHVDQPWRIHDATRDFTLEDVWAIETNGAGDEFGSLVAAFVEDDFPASAPRIVQVLWAARWRIGQLLGWDRPESGLGDRVASLRGRLPADLVRAPRSDLPGVPFVTLYETGDEWAAEMANRTVHTVMHLGWVADGRGGHRGQMAVLVRPNGRLGRAYMALIRPLRHRVVYPALLNGIERRWRESRTEPAS
ncbi:DUF2867 domain-containing protein [Nocardioides sp. zg-1228]|uniref:DUF2867 domain-containing protein n=1 Tax=Nocardioides sp. zg-1228 TaxID=2763008 RepID=UPI001642B3E4|nr:DUF2867 domain-containing protein [Nocardioides sp. zg-1228]MBC2932364.1 DUF2867 domain-containing protein [Nocardioides sp. zg-1228]QSF57878.1 DUF2867 domain-containing protein [Nocardioides sp. zg-1228]